MINDVVQALTASVLLALGASPGRVTEPQEATELVTLADAVLINVGTLTAARGEAMLAAANRAGKPRTLDPVVVGALTFRSDFCQRLLVYRPAAIRCNVSEISALV
ncbi:hydroxyethylthiazole kinase [Erwinia tracheiphila PSU-1]|nr:hydroxyethylthiazole kinase [Erwinia tracheiphila PSU-1]